MLVKNKVSHFFVDASGGTVKKFLLNLSLAKIRVIGNLALAAASSGIAATLLAGGRTAHSLSFFIFISDPQLRY